MCLQGRSSCGRQIGRLAEAGHNDHRRGGEQAACRALGDHIRTAAQHRNRRCRQAGTCCQPDRSWRVRPGSTSAGRRADRNGGKYHEHYSGAAPIGPQTRHAASMQHERSPFVTSAPPPHGRELSLPQAERGQLTILAISRRTPRQARRPASRFRKYHQWCLRAAEDVKASSDVSQAAFGSDGPRCGRPQVGSWGRPVAVIRVGCGGSGPVRRRRRSHGWRRRTLRRDQWPCRSGTSGPRQLSRRDRVT